MKITKIGSVIRNLLTLAMLVTCLVGFGNTARAECLTIAGTRIALDDVSGSKTNKMAKAMAAQTDGGWELSVWFNTTYRWNVHMYTEYQDYQGIWHMMPDHVELYWVNNAIYSGRYNKCMNVCPRQIYVHIQIFDPFTGELVSYNYAYLKQPPPPPPTN